MMISICNVTKNRNENLEKCWRTWLFADEIIIMDYGSDIPIKIDHPKVKVYRYESNTFSKTKGLNMAIGLAKGEIIIQADSDYYFNIIFSENDIKNGEFVTGEDISKTNDKNIVALTGFCMFWKPDWEKVNGFNERLLFYAYDDTDFYRRLEGIGLIHKKINSKDITHIPHSDQERLKEFGIEVSDSRVKKMMEKSWQKNKDIATNEPWTTNDQRSRYENI